MPAKKSTKTPAKPRKYVPKAVRIVRAEKKFDSKINEELRKIQDLVEVRVHRTIAATKKKKKKTPTPAQKAKAKAFFAEKEEERARIKKRGKKKKRVEEEEEEEEEEL